MGIGGKRELLSIEAACCFKEHFHAGDEDFLTLCWGGHRSPHLQAQKDREKVGKQAEAFRSEKQSMYDSLYSMNNIFVFSL